MVTNSNMEKHSSVQLAVPDPNDFDWDNTGKSFETYKGDDRARLESFYDDNLNQILEHQIVSGTIPSLL